jgi:hypothetical protein
MYGALKSVEKAANTAQFVVEQGGTMNGYRTIVSNQVASGDLTSVILAKTCLSECLVVWISL